MTTLLVGTTDGAHLFEEKKGGWKKVRSFLKGESVNHFAVDSKSGKIYAATTTDGLFISKDKGRTWKRSGNGLHIKRIWTIALHPKNPKIVLAGTHYGHIFKSLDGGDTWTDMESLYTAPGRKDWGIDWGYGTAGHTMHTILYDPAVKGRIYIVTSAGGAYRSNDDGATWERIREGTMISCTTYTKDTEQGTVAQHLEQVHGCTHRLALAPRRGGAAVLYQQNHCGLFKSENGGESWADISGNIRSRHGFPIAYTNGKKPAVWVIPADQEGQCKKHNSCIKRALEAWRSTDGGARWESFSDGLPKKAHTCVLRHAMSSGPDGGVYFGTTTGEVYGLESGSDSWIQISKGLARVQGVVAS